MAMQMMRISDSTRLEQLPDGPRLKLEVDGRRIILPKDIEKGLGRMIERGIIRDVYYPVEHP